MDRNHAGSSSARPRRELAARESNGTRVRLLWREGTRKLWVEVSEPGTDGALAMPVPPERALDAFNHPYAYAASHSARLVLESLLVPRRASCATPEHHEQ